jgi:transcriptional regulator with XRE-family HTH domain
MQKVEYDLHMSPVSAEQLAENFQRNLVALRHRMGITQTDLAKTTKLGQNHISGLERGTTRPNLETLARISAALGVSPWAMISPLND